MQFKRISVRNYRNIEFSRLKLGSPRVFLHGPNGQGKTNMLEALGLATALRPFRTHENRVVIGPAALYSEIVYDLDHEDLGETQVRARIKKSGKEVWIDGEATKRLSDFVGKFPTVILSSNDLQLTRGTPGNRRRFFDAFICGVDRNYFRALQTFQKLLQERNALLKQNESDAVVSAFESQMDEPALKICRVRTEILDSLMEYAVGVHREISLDGETLALEYSRSAELEDEGDYLKLLEKNRKRDGYLQSTGKGPHRDDFSISLNGMSADDFASEGQQRSITLSLSLAIIEFWQSRFGFRPVALADDALGELDQQRRDRFWSVLDKDLQIIATGTQLPSPGEKDDWRIVEVSKGNFTG